MKPWREIAHPHKDVREGSLQQSEFAADISAVVQGIASPEYQDAQHEQYEQQTLLCGKDNAA